MDRKLLVICGPTATGKTSLAIKLAKKFKGEIVSADSRQIYRGMDIGTGKDLPQGAKWCLAKFPISNFQFPIGFWETKNRTKIWGYDLVEPKEEFSVGEYAVITREIIRNIWKRKRLPVLVGGTGLYIKSLVDGIETSTISKDKSLRKSLETKSADELFGVLTQFDPVRAAEMNISDKKNPRRLVRAIEVANSRLPGLAKRSQVPSGAWRSGAGRATWGRQDSRPEKLEGDLLFIGLSLPKSELGKRIEKRINEKLKRGFEKELMAFIKRGATWSDQSMSSLGYRQWKGYIEGKKSKGEVTKDWIREEKKYAGRQMTWFKRDARTKWFNISKKNWQGCVERVVKKWYSSERKNLP
ncbi:MAG: tRNA (adenosine(37)-N6)-dimethylallyltransferase [Patescibacteria group bacterium]